jgi:homopolymeric O-antigen transport system ATP-binding protein
MTDIAIRVKDIKKRYRIPLVRANLNRNLGLLNSVKTSLNSVAQYLRPPTDEETLWALNGVDFDVKKGEVVGIVGQNGAGKSTILKLISRITEPTSGRIEIHGKVASLLEIGTGFHPDLTGRENVFINGLMMGMENFEIEKKFDQIVDFSGIERFIDTPVKYYSSGMYVRLGFAVAAHLDPEVLLVDEVLSVGDESFRKKSTGKMESLSGSGRTVVYISHNLPSILAMCKRCIWMDGGRIVADGPSEQVVGQYIESNMSQDLSGNDLSNAPRYGNGKAKFKTLDLIPLQSESGKEINAFHTGDDLEVKISIEANEKVSDIVVAIIIYDLNGGRLVDANTNITGHYFDLAPKQEAVVSFRLKNLLLKPGIYRVGLWLGMPNNEDIDAIRYAKELNVQIDTNKIKSTVIYPGLYQCEFTDKITLIS